MSLSDELKKLVEDSGINFRQNANSYIFTCPKCEKAEKLWMFKDTGQFICWYCAEIEGYRGKPEWALRDLLGLPLDDIRRKLYGSIVEGPLTLEAFDFTCYWGDKSDLPPDDLPLPEIEWPWNSYPIDNLRSRRGLNYLNTRGIPDEQARDLGLRFWPEKGRVLFPVIMGGKLVGYQARTIYPNTQPKILTSDGLRRDRALMGYDSCTQNCDSVVVVEGPIDGAKCKLCGPCVITMGKAVTRPQIEMIRKLNPKKVYLGLDRDADEEISRLLHEFSDRETYLLFPPTHRDDLGDCTPEEVLGVYKTAPKLTPGHLVCEFTFPENLFA